MVSFQYIFSLIVLHPGLYIDIKIHHAAGPPGGGDMDFVLRPDLLRSRPASDLGSISHLAAFDNIFIEDYNILLANTGNLMYNVQT
jgi:hypothetical protein